MIKLKFYWLFIFLYINTTFTGLSQSSSVSYFPSDSPFPNPDRGFYHHTEFHSNAQEAQILDINTLRGYYDSGVTLILRVFYLDCYVEDPIEDSYLQNMQRDFDAIREAGLKVIVRFAYSNFINRATPCSWSPIPPFVDANLQQIWSHINQLKPVLLENLDVISVLQAGFIGVWGEWYYTNNFVCDENIGGDCQPLPVTPTNQAPGTWDAYVSNVTTGGYAKRKAFLDSLLRAIPKRMIQIRTPHYKQALYGFSTAQNGALDSSLAYGNTAQARIGHHNDCFLASDTDQGTYRDIVNEKAYLAVETKYLVMGGETCDPNPPRSECTTATQELERFHWSYLNRDYHPSVLQSWENEDCFREIERKLGYRFELLSGRFSQAAQPGQAVQIELSLKNVGYAAPFNPYIVEMVLKHASNGETWSVELPEDPRRWYREESSHTIQHEINLPTDISVGTYDLLLRITSAENSLCRQPAYSIRLANKLEDGSDIWEEENGEATGLNRLGHSLDVNNTAQGAVAGSPLSFSQETPFAYWGFDEGTGNRVADRYGRYDGLVRKTYEWVSTGNGYALRFLGKSDSTHVDIENSASFDMGKKDFSFEAWIKLENPSVPNTPMVIMGRYNHLPMFYMSLQSPKKLAARVAAIENNNSVDIASDPRQGFSLEIGQWYHVVSTFDRDEYLTLYINGEPYGESVSISNLADINLDSSRNLFRIGAHGGIALANQYFEGLIDDVAVYKRLLKEGEVRQRYQRGIASHAQ